MSVSQNDEPDMINVKLYLEEFKDEFGQSLPQEQILRINVPRQIPTETTTLVIREAGQVAEIASFGAMFLSFMFAVSLSQLWSMLNGLQLASHFPLFTLKVPANANFVIMHLIQIATFDPMPEEWTMYVFNFPEMGQPDE